MSKTAFSGSALSGDSQQLMAGLRRLEKMLVGTGKAYLSKGDAIVDANLLLENSRIMVLGATVEGRTLRLPYVNREIIFASNPNNTFEFAVATDKTTIYLKPGESVKVFMDGFGGMDKIGGGAGGGQGPEGKRGPQGVTGLKGLKGDQGEMGPRGKQGIQGNPGPVDTRLQVRNGQLVFVTDEGTYVISATKLSG